MSLTKIEPEDTAVRVALWRALHVLADPDIRPGIERAAQGAKANGMAGLGERDA